LNTANTNKTRQSTYKRDIGLCSCNHCCRGKAASITYSECASVGLIIQHAMRMRCIILPSVVRLAVPFCFPHYLLNFMIFEKKTLLNIK